MPKLTAVPMLDTPATVGIPIEGEIAEILEPPKTGLSVFMVDWKGHNGQAHTFPTRKAANAWAKELVKLGNTVYVWELCKSSSRRTYGPAR